MHRHITTAAFSLAALSWPLGQGLLPDLGTETSDRYDAVSANPALESLSAGLLVLAGAFLVLGSLAAIYRLATVVASRGRSLMLAGSALTGLGGLARRRTRSVQPDVRPHRRDREPSDSSSPAAPSTQLTGRQRARHPLTTTWRRSPPPHERLPGQERQVTGYSPIVARTAEIHGGSGPLSPAPMHTAGCRPRCGCSRVGRE